ncbi:MAG: group 1 truncated hemoglobin [Prosthecobacter sp.]
MNPSTLYDRLGGQKTIDSLIPAFYVRVLADPELAPFFKDTSIEKLHQMQSSFFCMATGGPFTYSGKSMAHAHHGRGITARHFALFTGHLVETLCDLGVSQEETDEVIDRVNTYANEITGTSY